MKRYRLLLAYDGTHYAGWQVQPNGLSIQEVVQEKVSILTGAPTHVTGSGRTDAGVHALAQSTHLDAKQPINLRSLNGLLPPDIRALEIREVGSDFHARYSAEGKVYRYHLCTEPIQLPFGRLYSYCPRYRIDRQMLKEASKIFVGTRDYTSFVNECGRRDARRTIYRIDLFEHESELIVEFEGSGFLYKMVRNLMGAMLAVARGRLTLEELEEILRLRDRRLAPAPAPAHGLFLAEVKYPLEALDV